MLLCAQIFFHSRGYLSDEDKSTSLSIFQRQICQRRMFGLMGMLDRYRKPGGFLQLVMLLETCGTVKQEKFLKIVRYEAPLWHVEMKTKLVSLERIYSWSDSVLNEIVTNLQDLCLAVVIHAADEPLKGRLVSMVSHGRKRKIDDLLARNPPSSGEIATMQTKVVETARKMINDRLLRVEQFDPELAIDTGIEDRLNRSVGAAFGSPQLAPQPIQEAAAAVEFETDPDVVASVLGAPSESEDLPAHSGPAPAVADPANDVQFLRRKVAELAKEVVTLRQELKVAKSKLDQIKKIA